MEWNKIKEKYPKAFCKLLEFANYDRGYCDCQIVIHDDIKEDVDYYECWTLKSVRDLYDFFDEQGILIDLVYNQFNDWVFLIYNNKDEAIDADSSTKTRQQAEEKAFIKAFGILENN